MIQSEVFRNGVEAMFVEAGAIDGRESFGASVADVGLGSLEAGPVRGLLEPVRHDGREVTGNSLCAGVGQQSLNDPFRTLVLALAEFVMPNHTLCVDEVLRGPIVVGEGLPDRVVVVERDRILDVHVVCGPTHVADVVLEPELGSVDADHDEAVRLVCVRPRADVREACGAN